MSRLLEGLTEAQLLVLVGELLSGKGAVLSENEILQLADINDEFLRRELESKG